MESGCGSAQGWFGFMVKVRELPPDVKHQLQQQQFKCWNGTRVSAPALECGLSSKLRQWMATRGQTGRASVALEPEPIFFSGFLSLDERWCGSVAAAGEVQLPLDAGGDDDTLRDCWSVCLLRAEGPI